MARAGGILGKDLTKLAGTKQAYTEIADELIYGRLEGVSKGWGRLDYAVSYEGFTETAEIIPWELIEKKARQKLGGDPTVRRLNEALERARWMGKGFPACAAEIGIDTSTLYNYLKGRRHPNQEQEQLLTIWMDWLDSLLDSPAAAGHNLSARDPWWQECATRTGTASASVRNPTSHLEWSCI